MSYYSNKWVWITGASSGIGEALCVELDKLGAKIILSSRNLTELQRVRSLLTGPAHWVLPLDLADESTFESKVQEVIQKTGVPDILINNGGISQRSLALETHVNVDKQLMQVNYFGTVALTKALLPHFIAQKKGHIVTVSSVTGKFGTPYRSGYAASKHALHGFFDSLRAELHIHQIPVSLVCPGFIRTPITYHALTGDGTPLGMMDKGTNNGMDVHIFAQKMLRQVARQKSEITIAGPKEWLAVLSKRYAPWLLEKLLVKLSVR